MMFFRINKSGFTLMELIIAATILVIVLVGLIAAYTGCFALNETARNLTIATNGAQRRLEEIRNHNFDNIYNDYNGVNFEVVGLPDVDSEGSVIVDNTNPDLLQVTVTICWRQKGNRIIGEDINLNGGLDAGEDANGNGQLDSPVQIVTVISRR